MNLLQYTFFQHALLGSLLASIACGIIGTYIVTRRLVFISGGITHASFGGIGLGLFAGISPILSAAVFSVLSAFGVEWLSRRKDMREDSAIAVFWNRIFLSVHPSNRIYRFRPGVCPFAKDPGRDIRISADDVYCADHRCLPSYGRYRAGHLAAHHPANDRQPVHLQLQENHLVVYRHRFSGMSGRIVHLLPLESPFGSFNHILLHSDLCRLQNWKELFQKTVIITD